MPRIIPQRELRNQNAAIIDAVVQGETFVVTRHGTPVAELRPIQPKRKRFVSKEEILEISKHWPKVDYKKMREEMDAIADPYIHFKK